MNAKTKSHDLGHEQPERADLIRHVLQHDEVAYSALFRVPQGK
jgi:hypothetical protein